MHQVIRLSGSEASIQQSPKEVFALDVLMGLSSKPKMIPPKYFYDDEGSRIFQKIMALKEYYPTKCESEIFENHAADIARLLPRERINIIELGAGDGTKTKVLLSEILKSGLPVHYYPLDISESVLEVLCSHMAKELPELEMTALACDYFAGINWIRNHVEGRSLVLFLGSSIGNFNLPQARVFLRTLWNATGEGDLFLCGFDLKKDMDVLLSAYNDPAGVTKKFNLNLLTRLNRELEADFDIAAFDHFGTYNVTLGAMESYLISRKRQTVHIKELNKAFRFKAFEPIHTEFSFKYLPEEIEDLAVETGYTTAASFFDSRRYFCDTLLKVRKL